MLALWEHWGSISSESKDTNVFTLGGNEASRGQSGMALEQYLLHNTDSQ